MERSWQVPINLALVGGALLILGGGCGVGAEPGGFAFDNNLFENTERLLAEATGDPSRPNLSWPSTGRSMVVVGVFRRRIDVRRNLITNTWDLVWLWHTGLPAGREGNITWSDGNPVVDGVPEDGVEPPALRPGTYYWAVWAFDDRGVPVASSVELTLEVP